MRLALAEAEKGRGRTHPNPAVGSLVVRDGRIVGRGYHQKAGQPHAEAMALAQAGKRAKGAELYVTLEPCDHFGRTPPCTQAIIDAGIARVYVGSSDPNPLVSGRGLRRLRRAGLEVKTGVLRQACDEANRSFFKYITTGRPFVVLKAAITLDGKIATATGDSRWVTGAAARERVHLWRDELDAILVGAGTVIADDPLLTTRLEGSPVSGRVPRTAVRIVLDGRLAAPPEAKIFDVTQGPVLVATTRKSGRALDVLKTRGVEVISLPGSEDRVDLAALLDELGRRGLTSLLVEGGAEVYGGFLRGGLADELRVFLAPRLAGAEGLSWSGNLGIERMDAALRLSEVSLERLGDDVLLVGRPATPSA